VLEYKNVDISYQKEALLKNISLVFPDGCVTTVIGPNGCGKTSLLQCLIGSSRVSAGEVLLDGKDFFSEPPRERARRLAFLPQVRTVIPTLPVRTLVSHGRFPYMGFARRETRRDIEMIERAMSSAHVSEYADMPADILSGGIRQRVFLAMILAQDTPYIVLDEPSTYLDPQGQRDFLQLVRELKAGGKTVIMVLHDLNQALEVSDGIVLMNRQGIVFSGTAEECSSGDYIENTFQVKCERFRRDGRSYCFFE